jgi:hypothetical protein
MHCFGLLYLQLTAVLLRYNFMLLLLSQLGALQVLNHLLELATLTGDGQQVLCVFRLYRHKFVIEAGRHIYTVIRAAHCPYQHRCTYGLRLACPPPLAFYFVPLG